MCEFTECRACEGDGHVEGDVTLDCYYCWGTGQTKISEDYGRPEQETE